MRRQLGGDLNTMGYDFFKIFDFLKFEFSEHFSDWGGAFLEILGYFSVFGSLFSIF
jgi:hypothetical protein